MTTLEYTLSVPLLILLIQLGGAYLRYLPFERICTKELRSQLAKLCLLWSVLAFFLYYYIFAVFGLRIIVYKLLLFLGWIPYFLLTAYVIRCHMAQHIFIFGMASSTFRVFCSAMASICLNSGRDSSRTLCLISSNFFENVMEIRGEAAMDILIAIAVQLIHIIIYPHFLLIVKAKPLGRQLFHIGPVRRILLHLGNVFFFQCIHLCLYFSPASTVSLFL